MLNFIKGLVSFVVLVAVFLLFRDDIYAMLRRTPLSKGDREIERTTDVLTDNGIAKTRVQNQPVLNASAQFASTNADEAEALNRIGDMIFDKTTNELRAKLRARGKVFGDFSINPGAVIVEPFQGTAVLNPASLKHTGKSICGQGTLVMYGRVSSDPDNRVLNIPVDGRGWVDTLGNRLPNPEGYRPVGSVNGWPLVHEDAPYMAALVYLDTDQPYYNWKPVQQAPDGTVTAVALEVTGIPGCHEIKWAFNDFIVDNAFPRPSPARDGMARNYSIGGPIEVRVIQ